MSEVLEEKFAATQHYFKVSKSRFYKTYDCHIKKPKITTLFDIGFKYILEFFSSIYIETRCAFDGGG